MVITDIHPDFLSTRYAEDMKIPHIRVSHHFAHILACMIEHNISERVLGVSFDGMGFGEDGTIWGGEFLISNYKGFRRFANLKPIPLPGGDLATKEPLRMAISYLFDVFGNNLPSLLNISQKKQDLVILQIKKKINTPLTSSCGRFFDAVSSILGIAPEEIEFEGEAAMMLEAISFDCDDAYKIGFLERKEGYVIDVSSMIKGIVKDLRRYPIGYIGGKFHNTLAMIVCSISIFANEKFGINKVLLTGGCFQNALLLRKNN